MYDSFTTNDQKFIITMNGTLVYITTGEGDIVQFAVLRSQLNCTQYSVCPRTHYLGFYVPDTTGLTGKTHGMIGMDHNKNNMICYYNIILYRSVPKTVNYSE